MLAGRLLRLSTMNLSDRLQTGQRYVTKSERPVVSRFAQSSYHRRSASRHVGRTSVASG